MTDHQRSLVTYGLAGLCVGACFDVFDETWATRLRLACLVVGMCALVLTTLIRLWFYMQPPDR